MQAISSTLSLATSQQPLSLAGALRKYYWCFSYPSKKCETTNFFRHHIYTSGSCGTYYPSLRRPASSLFCLGLQCDTSHILGGQGKSHKISCPHTLKGTHLLNARTCSRRPSPDRPVCQRGSCRRRRSNRSGRLRQDCSRHAKHLLRTWFQVFICQRS